MKQKRPTSLQIFNLRYEVIWAEESPYGIGDDAYGICQPSIPALVFYMPQPTQMLVDTVLHEIIHAINRHYACGAGESMTDEEIATRIASGILTVRQQNPKFWSWWLELLDDK